MSPYLFTILIQPIEVFSQILCFTIPHGLGQCFYILFDFSIDNVTVTDSYGALTPSDGEKLVQMDLTVTNTSDRQLTMFAEDFQLQWGDGDEDYGTCLTAVDTDMVPYSYTLEPGNSHSGIMLVEVPEDSMALTVAYQEMLASGKKGDAYFVEAAL